MLIFWSDRDKWWITASTSTKFCRETYNKYIFQDNIPKQIWKNNKRNQKEYFKRRNSDRTERYEKKKKTRRDRIRNKTYTADIRIQNLLTECRREMITTCKIMDRTWILRRALELKFKGRRHTGWSRTRWFSQVVEESKRSGNSWQEIKKRRLWE
jgi:hypothetical protein